jgi:hypothetical protein
MFKRFLSCKPCKCDIKIKKIYQDLNVRVIPLTINKDDAMSEKSRYTYLNSTEQSIPIEMETMALGDNVGKDEFLKINGIKMSKILLLLKFY